MSIKAATLGEVMTRRVVTAPPTASLERVRELMLQNRVNRVVIVNEYSNPLGMITGKDLLRYGLDRDAKNPNEVIAHSLMSKPLVTEREATSVSYCAQRMLDCAISSVVVIRKEAIVGIVTKTDLCMFYAVNGGTSEEVRKWMTAKPITVRPFQGIIEAAKIMTEKNISRLPVVEGSLVGIVTISDLTAISPSLSPVAMRVKARDATTWEKAFAPTTAVGPRSVGEIMTKNPITVLDTSYLSEAAKSMISHHISGLPVLDSGNSLVGMVTKTDVALALARAQ
jgi:CBS domain-containing protein